MESSQKDNHQTQESKNSCNPMQEKIMDDPDVPIIVKEDQADLDQEKILQAPPESSVDRPMGKDSRGLIGRVLNRGIPLN